MSSAAQLRKFGRGTAIVASAALVMTSFGPAAFASWDDAPQTPSIVDPLQTDGTIGLVDTDKTEPGTQGATMVTAGQDDQALADVRIVIPNRFKKGDSIDLRLFDRSATEESAGNTNSGNSTKVEFSAAPTVASVALANDDTTVASVNPGLPTNGAKTNTESTESNPWAAVAGETGTEATKPSVQPAFDVTTFASASHGAKDVVRLTVNTDQSTGDENAVWVVTLEDLKVNLGSAVTPGELRLVPFAWNTNVKPVASPWFYGNSEFNDNGTVATGDDVQREIGIYTVPAYVSPVKIEYGNRDIVADALPQDIGDITLSETQNYAWQDGNLVVKIGPAGAGGVQIASVPENLTVTVNGQEVKLANNAVNVADGTITIPVTGTKATVNDTVTIKGIQLVSGRAQSITYSIDGALSTAVNDWLADPAGSSPEITRDGGRYAYSDIAFINQAATTDSSITTGEAGRQLNIAASFPVVQSPLAPASAAVTARSLADRLPAGNYTTTDGGITYGGAGLPTLTRSTAVSGGYTYTAAVPGAGAATDTYVITGNPASFTVATPAAANLYEDLTADLAVTTTPSTPGPQGLPTGTYVASSTDGTMSAGDTLTNGSFVLTYVDADGTGAGTTMVWRSNAATPVDYTLTSYTGNGNLVVEAGVDVAPTAQPTLVVDQGSAANPLPAGQYSVSPNGLTVTGPGVVLTRPNTGSNTWTVQSATAGGITPRETYVITGTQPNMTFIVDNTGEASGILDGNVTATTGANYLTPGQWTVTRTSALGATPEVFTITDGVTTITGVQNGVAFDANGLAAGAPQAILQGLENGQTFTVPANIPTGTVNDRGVAPEPYAPDGVNQTDIEAPLDALAATGQANAESARIGGNNRYETAAKIAEMWANGDKSVVHGKFKNVIIASGENFPDALSAAYLSQRMNAPILLTMRNSIPQDTLEALRDRQVEKVFIVGGNEAVSKAVEDQLRETASYVWVGLPNDPTPGAGGVAASTAKLEVQRIAGTSRYSTNQLVNMYAAAWGGNRTIGKTVYKHGEAGKYTAIFARGDNFPDALAAGVLTAGVNAGSARYMDNALPLILTEPNRLSESAVAQIDNLDVEHGLIIGNETAISDDVKKSIEEKGLTDTRIGGKDRYFTAAAVSEFAMRAFPGSKAEQYPGLGFLGAYDSDAKPLNDNQATAFLATGLKFPDALTSSPWIGRNNDVLNLVWPNDLTDGTRDFLTKRASDVDRVVGLGLGQAVSNKVLIEGNKLVSGK